MTPAEQRLFDDLRALVEQLRGDIVRQADGSGADALIRHAQLTGTLTVASNSKTGSTSATAKFLIPDNDSPGDLKDGDTFTVVNRSLDASGVSGDYMIVALIGNVWSPLWIDC